MAESTLSISRDELRQEVGHFLGYGRDSDSWTTAQEEDIDAAIKKGLRQFYFPPNLTGENTPYQWRFLKPIDTLTTIASYSTGTIAITNGGTTVTLTTGVWPFWAATHGKLLVGTASYEIDSRTSDSEIELVDAWDEDTITAEEYVLQHDGNYDLDDDFGGAEGDFTFEPAAGYSPIVKVGEGQIRAARQQSDTRSRPKIIAIRPKESDGSDGQRFEAMLQPIPDAVYVLKYRKIILANALTASFTYPLGGMAHAETVLASCIAAAELQVEDTKGPRWDDFLERLAASVAYDKKAHTQDYFGYNGDNSDGSNDIPRSRVSGLVTYTGGQ